MNQSIWNAFRFLAGWDHIPLAITQCLRLTQWGGLGLICWILWNNRICLRRSPRLIQAAAMSLLCWFLIFSPISWEHYQIYLCPLWGWLLWESCQKSGWRWPAILSLILVWCPLAAIPSLPIPKSIHFHVLLGTIIMLTLAIYHLWVGGKPTDSPDRGIYCSPDA